MSLARWTSRQRGRQNQRQSRRLVFDGRRCAGRCGSARHAGGLRRLGGPGRTGGRQVSGPKTVGVRGHASGRRQHRTATEEPVITIIFQNRCWVSGPGVEFTGKGGEEPLSR